MTINTISNIDLFNVLDESTNKTYYGCDQEWYATQWQRCSGCGPTVASNILFYLKENKVNLSIGQRVNSKKNCLSFMSEIWKYVTPTNEGIPTTKMFYEAVLTYTKSKKLMIEYDFCDLPKDKSLRPKLSQVLDFIQKALINDSPIAFLNLCNGEEKNLCQWHWVTIISLEYADDKKSAFIKILDEGLIKEIDIALWYNTTTLGGGFVYFFKTVDIMY